MKNIFKRFLRIGFVFLLLSVLSLPSKAADAGSRAGIVSVSSGKLNVRSAASSTGKILSSLSKGSYVTLLEQSGSWWKVEYAQGRYGYCHGSYLTSVPGDAASVVTQSGNLNVRKGPGTSYSKIDTLSKGDWVIMLETTGSWTKVLFDGTRTGYVSTQYLSVGNSSVSLWVKNMKQMDPRWADREVASSGKTLSQIGCATTAIAMVESHRTGIVRYPDEMMSLLRYTSSGNVYWPEHYTVVTKGDSYLTDLYSLLKRGKPVLFGATNSKGSQHWVVVTGFSGGTLRPEAFSVQDPGSYTRTNLKQFLEIYPNFYKYFYY